MKYVLNPFYPCPTPILILSIQVSWAGGHSLASEWNLLYVLHSVSWPSQIWGHQTALGGMVAMEMLHLPIDLYCG